MISKRVLLIAAALLVVSATGAWAATTNVDNFSVNHLVIGATDVLNLQSTSSYGRDYLDSYASTVALLKNGYGPLGNWAGVGGIQSTPAHADGTKTLGILTGAEYKSFFGPTKQFFGAVPADATNLVKYTWAGDINLDGTVDDNDLGQFLNYYSDAGATPVTGYGQGDLNFDGVVDDNDLGILLNNYSDAGPLPYVNPPAAAAAAAAVPEPSTFILLGLGIVFGFMGLRRRLFS